MSGKRTRIGFIHAVMAISSMALLGGCTHADPAAWDTFVGDLVRNAAAALLL